MILSLRGVLLLLLAAPLIAAGAWAPELERLAAGVVLLCLGLFIMDWRLARDVDRFDVSRRVDTRLSLGADNPVFVTVHNRSRLPTRLWLRDEPPEAFTLERRVLEGEVKPRGTWEGVYHVHPRRRGDYSFGDFNLRWQGSLKLLIRQGRVEIPESVRVYPNLRDIRRYDLLLRRNRLQELGLRQSRRFGEGTEFERLREYLPDDEFRSIDWKATARRHRPITIEYQTERSQNVIPVIDVGRMMQSPVGQMAKLDFVINAALLLAYVVVGKGDKVGLMTFADGVRQFIPPRQGRGQFYHLLEALYAVEAQAVEADYQRALTTLALKQRKRALVVIFTDLSGGVSVKTLIKNVAVLSQRNLPLVVTISDPDVHGAARRIPYDTLSVYQRAAAMQLLDEREVVLESLRRQGVLTLDVPADRLSMAVINRYLELKGRMLL